MFYLRPTYFIVYLRSDMPLGASWHVEGLNSEQLTKFLTATGSNLVAHSGLMVKADVTR